MVRNSVTLLGNETREVVVKVVGGRSARGNSYPLEVTFDAGADGRAALHDTLHVNVIARKSITVNGDLADWAGVLPQTTSANAGLGRNLTEKAWLPMVPFEDRLGGGVATGYLAYDDRFFYFAAKVADDSPDEGTVRFAQARRRRLFLSGQELRGQRQPATGDRLARGRAAIQLPPQFRDPFGQRPRQRAGGLRRLRAGRERDVGPRAGRAPGFPGAKVYRL